MFGQTFSLEDLATIALLVILEGVLSIDNALVLGLLAARVNLAQRTRALWYGLIGAFVFRLIAVALAAYLVQWTIIKLLGGIYLLWVMLKFFLDQTRERRKNSENSPESSATEADAAGFWQTVIAIEVTDIAFAIDSILAAVALVGSPPKGTPPGALHPKLWVIFTGGMLGVVLMRFAAALFIRLLHKFPRLNLSAYLLVGLIGVKLVVDWGARFTPLRNVDFQDPTTLAFWIFWGLMLACLAMAFLPQKRANSP